MSVRAADEGTAISSRPGRALRAQVPRLGGRLKRRGPGLCGGPAPGCDDVGAACSPRRGALHARGTPRSYPLREITITLSF